MGQVSVKIDVQNLEDCQLRAVVYETTAPWATFTIESTGGMGTPIELHLFTSKPWALRELAAAAVVAANELEMRQAEISGVAPDAVSA